jgi:hypothetical protein
VAVRKTSRAALFLSVACAVVGHGPALSFEPQQIRFELIRAKTVSETDQVRVTGLPPAELARFKSLNSTSQQQAVFPVSVAKEPSNGTASPMLGSYRVEAMAVVFEPRFPFREGVSYQSAWNLQIGSPASKKFAIELSDQTAPEVAQVYPTSKTLPENQLKFYIHFSKAMRQGEAYQHIQLFEKATGKLVKTPFLELGEELWDPDGRRFTLYFDPGRIKRGLQPRRLFGPTLEAGKDYTLVVSQGWKDASAGKPLKQSFRKTFRATEPDTTVPDHRQWKVISPAGGTKRPLKIEFNEPLDHAMLHRVIQPESPQGELVNGVAEVLRGETSWVFTPSQKWSVGIHTLKISAALEDRAGNSIGRPFEVDMIENATKQIPDEYVTLRFRVR